MDLQTLPSEATVAYRRITVAIPDSPPETFSVRVSDEALASWLAERARLREVGYPDRPPDVDTPNLRAWLPRPDEESHPYFQRLGSDAAENDGTGFMVLSVVWHNAAGLTAKVLLQGFADGSFLNRVRLTDEHTGEARVDQAHLLGWEVDPDAVWEEVETILGAINAAPMEWGPDDPVVSDYLDFVALDAEVALAKDEARAAGLLSTPRVH